MGAGIIATLDARASKLYEENSKRFAKEVKLLIDKLEEDKLDKSFINSNEFISILLNILGKVGKVYEEEKIKLFAQIFVNSISTKTTMKYKEGFIAIIDGLSVDHIRIFTELYNQSEAKPENEKYSKASEIGLRLKIGKPFVDAYCEHLSRFGLLRDWGISTLNFYPGSYEITSYGHEFASFLKDVNS